MLAGGHPAGAVLLHHNRGYRLLPVGDLQPGCVGALMQYVSLHHHSTYSYMDGFGTPEQHVARAADLGMSALALTEHGNVSSHVRLEKAANKLGIKPIFGCELYTGGVDEETRGKFKWHLTVLAMNDVGYRNLMWLVTAGWKDGFYFEPTVSGEMLAEHHEGLIVLSGCGGSKMATDLLGGKGRREEDADYKIAKRTAEKFRDLMGDRFYLEVQAFPELERTRSINTAWAQMGKELGIPLVATGDVHYTKPEESSMQVILHAAGRGNNSFEQQQQSWGYDVPLSPPLSDKEIIKKIKFTGLKGKAAEAAVKNAAEIAARCNVELPKAERLRFPLPDDHTTKSLIWAKLREGWKYRNIGRFDKKRQAEYADRVKYEMGVIEPKDFMDYFLMLSDAVAWAKDSGIPVGPARGSAAASLVCYLLRITEIDPMDFPTMFFERFVDINRMDIPDVDLDFDDERRGELREYLISVYGEDRVGNIGTYIRYRGKNSVKDAGRVMGMSFQDMDKFNSLIIERSGGDSRFDATLEDTVDMFPQAKEIYDRNKDALDSAFRLEGNLRGMSVHAAGLVVANTPITEVCALYTRKSGKNQDELSVLSVDKYDAEYLELMKMDFLGLTTMGMIRIALELSGLTLDDLYAIPNDDPATLQGFIDNDVVGIFQFEGRATRLVNRDVVPSNFMEVVDVNALSRPGPLFSGTTHTYIDVKHGNIKREYIHPAVDKITEYTKGQIIYQEQILQIVREVGGFPWTHAAAIRKIISQKKGEAAFNEMFGMFIEGAERIHGIDEKKATYIWKKLVTAGTYAFNVAHSVSYSTLAWWCMWLKKNHPLAFYTAQLRKTEKEKWPRLIKDAMRHDIMVLGPDLDVSGTTWSIDGEIIRAGWSQVPGIGETMAGYIVADRDENGPFHGWEDLLRVKGIGPAKLKMMRDASDNEDPFNLLSTKKRLQVVRDAIAKGELAVPTPTATDSGELLDWPPGKPIVWAGLVRTKNYQDTIENIRARTGDEVDEIMKNLKRPDLVTSCILFCYDEGDEDVYLRIDRFKYPKLKAALENLRTDHDIVIGTGKKREGAFGISIYIENLAIIDPDD